VPIGAEREIPRTHRGDFRPPTSLRSALTGGVWAVLALFVATGLGLRLINLDSGLWYDEIVTLKSYVRLPTAKLLTSCTEFNNHMLFSLLAQASIASFGESPWALRLPAVLFGLASIPALWWLSSLLIGRRESLYAALLLTVSYHHVFYSQSARGYTGLLFFSLLSTGLFLKGLRRPGWRPWITYAAVNGLALFTHLTAAFTIAAHGIVWLCLLGRSGPHRCWRPLGGFALSAAAGAILYAPLIPKLLDSFQKHVGADSAFLKVKAWTSPLWTAREVLEGLGLGPIAIAAFALVAVLATAGFISLARKSPVAVAAMVLSGPIALAVFWGFKFHIWPRYFFPLIGPGVIFVVHGVDVIARAVAPRAASIVTASAVAALAIGSVVSLFPTWSLPKQDYEGARDWLVANSRPGEPVLVAGMSALSYRWLYAPDWTEIEAPADLDRVLAEGHRTWFVYTFPTQLKAERPGVLERAEERFHTVREFPGTMREGAVVVMRSR
jgi:hypothetical protein